MKKFLPLAVFVVAAVTALAGCGPKTESKIADNVYEIEAAIEGETLVCSQKTTVYNRYADGLDELVFNVYANAYEEGSEAPGYVEAPQRFGGCEITSVTVAGQEVGVEYGKANQSVKIPVPAMKTAESVDISMKYVVTLAECDLRLGKCGEYYNLSGFYPQTAIFADGKFREDVFSTIGDPVCSDYADFKVRVRYPEGGEIAGPCETGEKSVENGICTAEFSGRKIRDFALAYNKNFRCFSSEYDGIKIDYVAVTENQERLDAAVNAVKTFSEAFGKYPYSRYVVVETPFASEGMEFSGLVYIDPETDDSTIIHETAHQWWYNLVGNDNVADGWLDEGLTTFSTAYYRLLNGDEAGFDAEISKIRKAYCRYEQIQRLRDDGQTVMNRPIYEYTPYQYDMLAYNKGCMLIDALYKASGRKNFDKALRYYVEKNAFSIVGADELVEAFDIAGKRDVAAIVSAYLEGREVVASFRETDDMGESA